MLGITGCAGKPEPEPIQTAPGIWYNQEITADGQTDDWPDTAPQYTAQDKTTRIWVNNNLDVICLLAEIKNPQAIRQLAQAGLTFTIQTQEKEAGPFSITLKGDGPTRRHCRPGSDAEETGQKASRPPDPPDTMKEEAQAMAKKPFPPPELQVKLPDDLVVVYPFSSGPMIMSMEEARTKGLTLGMAGNPKQEPLIFEAVISLDAVFFDTPQQGGSPVIISLSAVDNGRPKKGSGQKGNDGGPPGGGSPGDGPSGGGPSGGGPPDGGKPPGGGDFDSGKSGGKADTKGAGGLFKAAIKITLAGPVE